MTTTLAARAVEACQHCLRVRGCCTAHRCPDCCGRYCPPVHAERTA